MATQTLANRWNAYMLEVYASRKGPGPLGTVVFEEIEAQAKEKLQHVPGAFMYAAGTAGTGSTYRANLRAFERYRIVPRMLVDATTRNLETLPADDDIRRHPPSPNLPLSNRRPIPLLSRRRTWPSSRCRRLSIPFVMSTVATRSIELVAAANGPTAHRWFQLYWPADPAVTLSILARAKAAGFAALVLTLDTMMAGWRTHDINTAYVPFRHGVSVQVGTSDPVFMRGIGREPLTALEDHPQFPYDAADMDRRIAAGDARAKDAAELGAAWLKVANNGKFRTWDDLQFLRDNWDGPFLLKGIQSVQDAEKALEYGVDGIVVSNHGGRQVDGAIPALYALAHIMKSPKVREAQASGKLTVLFDSGIRTGPDIFKALALGAQAVLVGRPYLYASVVAGQAGVEQLIKHTVADLDTTLALAGYRSIAEIQGRAQDVLLDLGEPVVES
ncbi:Fmn dependent [Mycena kentingensis (nom. inval.)]|nr:Fmn dependent [Mycena kentingensis (nom. inval.)]